MEHKAVISSTTVQSVQRLLSEHAFLEAFANHYVNFAATIRARLEGRKPTELELDFPGAEEGLRGMKLIRAVVKSSDQGAVWTRVSPAAQPRSAPASPWTGRGRGGYSFSIRSRAPGMAPGERTGRA